MQGRIRKKSGSGASSLILFTAGLVIAIITTSVIIRACTNLVEGNDDSRQKFTALANKIKILSGKTAIIAEESVLTRVEYTEAMLFFDKDTKGMVSLYNPQLSESDRQALVSLGLDTFAIADRPKLMSFFLGKGFSGESLTNPFVFSRVVFLKPGSCGNDACAALCSKFTITKADPEKLRNTLPEFLGYFGSSRYEFYLASCDAMAVETFPDVERFIMKPAKEANIPIGREADYLRTAKTLGNYALRTDYFGAVISSPMFGFSKNKGEIPKDYEIITPSVPFQSGIETYIYGAPHKSNRLFFIENLMTENPDLVEFTRNNFVTITKSGKDMVLCYEAPCLSPAELKKYDLQKALEECAVQDSCTKLENELFYNLVSAGREATVTISKREGKIYFKINDTLYENDLLIRLRIVKGSDEPAVDKEITVKIKQVSSSLNMWAVVLEEGAGNYRFVRINAQTLEEASKENPPGEVPILDFIFEETDLSS